MYTNKLKIVCVEHCNGRSQEVSRYSLPNRRTLNGNEFIQATGRKKKKTGFCVGSLARFLVCRTVQRCIHNINRPNRQLGPVRTHTGLSKISKESVVLSRFGPNFYSGHSDNNERRYSVYLHQLGHQPRPKRRPN